MFVSELRRPAVRGHTYHQILIVEETMPSRWEYIASKYNDVYYLQEKITSKNIMQKINPTNAFALILLASRNEVTKVDEEFVSSTTLFSYLKLDSVLPAEVFFTVELTSASNIAGWLSMSA
jgi:hypothetical protein